jgi:Recombinase/Recombinase zinc beta ribbon domain
MANVTAASDAIPTVYVGIESGRAGAESPDSQIRVIAQHPDAIGGGRFWVGTFKESGKSGFKGERGPELAAAIAAAKAAAAEYGRAELWVFHTSRLARGSGEKGHRSYMKLWADLLYEGVQVRSVTDDESALRPVLVGIASEQNHKYSADLSAHVKRGKGEQRERGDRPGGKLNDGYVQRVLERDAKDKITKREYDFDPTRQPTIARMFELLLQGLPDARVGKALNREDHHTEDGGEWDHRSVGDKARNHWYAGAVVWYRDEEREEVIWDPPTPHPAYITRDDFERLAAMRQGRDKATGSNRKPGRPNKRHLMAKLARCERCGAKMRAKTASYKRKDGTKNYGYICDTVSRGTGGCDAPVVNGEVADLELVKHLNGLFIDSNSESFLQRVGVTRDTEREEVEAVRDREQKRLDKLREGTEKMRRRYRDHVAAGDDDRAALAEESILADRAEVEQAEHRIAEYDGMLAAEPDPADAVLDLWQEVRSQVRDALGRAGIPEVRAALAATFDYLTIDTTPDGVYIRCFLTTKGRIVGVKRLSNPAEKCADAHE